MCVRVCACVYVRVCACMCVHVCVCEGDCHGPCLSPQNMPAWKCNIVKKRRDEQAAADAEKQQRQREWEAKLAEIAAMPPWKRKMFLERNPQYKID